MIVIRVPNRPLNASVFDLEQTGAFGVLAEDMTTDQLMMMHSKLTAILCARGQMSLEFTDNLATALRIG